MVLRLSNYSNLNPKVAKDRKRGWFKVMFLTFLHFFLPSHGDGLDCTSEWHCPTGMVKRPLSGTPSLASSFHGGPFPGGPGMMNNSFWLHVTYLRPGFLTEWE